MTDKPNNGAIVEIDEFRLGRDGIFLLGAREAIDRHIQKLDFIIGHEPNAAVKAALLTYRELMAKDRDGIAVALTRKALTDGAGTLTEL